MKFCGVILLLGSILLVAGVFTQSLGQDDLPSAPSAVQEQLSKPKPVPPPKPAPTPAQPQTSAPSDAASRAAAKNDAPSSDGGGQTRHDLAFIVTGIIPISTSISVE